MIPAINFGQIIRGNKDFTHDFEGRQLNKASHYPDGFVIGEDIGLVIILNEDLSISIDLRKKTQPLATKPSRS